MATSHLTAHCSMVCFHRLSRHVSGTICALSTIAEHAFGKEVSVRCDHCHRVMRRRSSRTVLDESGSLSITAWRCLSCQSDTEELFVLSRDTQPRRIRYAVAPAMMVP